MSTLLTIMVPTTPSRLYSSFPELVQELSRQCAEDPRAEFVAVLDPEVISLGEKINWMTYMAAGKFVSVIADDDMPVPHYVETVCDAIELRPDVDVVSYDFFYYIAGAKTPEWPRVPAPHQYIITESVENKGREAQTATHLFRYPSDKCAWSRDFRLRVPCVHTTETSDMEYVKAASEHDVTELHIDEPLYHFYYHPAKTKGKHYRRKLDDRPARPTMLKEGVL